MVNFFLIWLPSMALVGMGLVVLYMVLTFDNDFKLKKSPARECPCGGNIYWHNPPRNLSKNVFNVGHYECDKCEAHFNSGMIYWTEEDMVQAVKSRNRMKAQRTIKA